MKICKIPTDISKDIKALNDLRNGLTHSFFPDNLRRNKPIYKGKRIYSLEGFKEYQEDTKRINDFFMKLIYGIKSD